MTNALLILLTIVIIVIICIIFHNKQKSCNKPETAPIVHRYDYTIYRKKILKYYGLQGFYYAYMKAVHVDLMYQPSIKSQVRLAADGWEEYTYAYESTAEQAEKFVKELTETQPK